MGISILIADKDKSNRNYIKQTINSIGEYIIVEVDEAREFISSAISIKHSLIIMDINIHQQNYEKIIEIIRSARPKGELPIIVISYAIEKDKILSLLKLGIEDFILKPFNNNTVVDKLKYILEKQNSQANSVIFAELENNSSGKNKFLLIDHDRTFRNQFIKLFSEKHEIITADNGEEGLNYFEKYRPEYVFISEHLKIINERMLVQKIRGVCDGDTKIYFLSTVLKSSSMRSSLFNGVVEKAATPEFFLREFVKVVWGEETNQYQKALKLVRNKLPALVNNSIAQCLENVLKDNVTVFNPKEDYKVTNETLASVELIDERKEFSVTVGLYGASKDIMLIAEKIIGSPVSFNTQAIEAIGGVVSEIASLVNQQLAANGIKLNLQGAKVNSRLENRLNYEWDVNIFIKDSRNSHYVAGIYCSKYI